MTMTENDIDFSLIIGLIGVCYVHILQYSFLSITTTQNSFFSNEDNLSPTENLREQILRISVPFVLPVPWTFYGLYKCYALLRRLEDLYCGKEKI